jgi:hypothetical protein
VYSMVSTRRGTINAKPPTAGIEWPKLVRQESDVIHVLVPSTKKVEKALEKPKVLSTPHKMALSGNVSEHDLSLTSPSTSGTPEVLVMITPKKQQASIDPTKRTVSSALRRLAPRPFANMSGSCHNPIIVNETSSPPRQIARGPKRRHKHKKLTEPHQFAGNGYRDLYSYGVTRPALPDMPANGSTFTGNQSHDIYRMMNAKITAAPDFSPNAAWGRHTLNVPFEVQYPLSAPVLAQYAPQSKSPYAQHYQAQAPPKTDGYPAVPSQNEGGLYRRAFQYIRESSQPSPQKRRLCDADPDETSEDGTEEYQRYARPQLSRPSPQLHATPACTVRNVDHHVNHKPTVHRDPDPDFILGRLIEHTSLVTSLLQVYPQSTDRKGLRDAISMMIQIQNQHMTEWMNVESQNSRKRMKKNTDSHFRLASYQQPAITPAMRLQNEKDHKLRQVLSADADMWQDGTGHGVADAFAAETASSPVANSFDGKVAEPSHMLSSPTMHDQNQIRADTGTIDSAISTLTQSVLGREAAVAPCGQVPTTPVHHGVLLAADHMSMRSKDSIKTPRNALRSPDALQDPITPSPQSTDALVRSNDDKINPSSQQKNRHSRIRTDHGTILQPAPSSDDDALHVHSNADASSSFHSESSSDFRTRRPVFRFERRVAADAKEAESTTVPAPTAE